jgi:hypothetical protein
VSQGRRLAPRAPTLIVLATLLKSSRLLQRRALPFYRILVRCQAINIGRFIVFLIPMGLIHLTQ